MRIEPVYLKPSEPPRGRTSKLSRRQLLVRGLGFGVLSSVSVAGGYLLGSRSASAATTRAAWAQSAAVGPLEELMRDAPGFLSEVYKAPQLHVLWVGVERLSSHLLRSPVDADSAAMAVNVRNCIRTFPESVPAQLDGVARELERRFEIR